MQTLLDLSMKELMIISGLNILFLDLIIIVGTSLAPIPDWLAIILGIALHWLGLLILLTFLSYVIFRLIIVHQGMFEIEDKVMFAINVPFF